MGVQGIPECPVWASRGLNCASTVVLSHVPPVIGNEM